MSRKRFKEFAITLLVAASIIAWSKVYEAVIQFSTIQAPAWLRFFNLGILIVAITSLVVFVLNLEHFGLHERLGQREYEKEDLVRFKRNLANSLRVFCTSLLLWGLFFALNTSLFSSTLQTIRSLILLFFPIAILIVLYKLHSNIQADYPDN